MRAAKLHQDRMCVGLTPVDDADEVLGETCTDPVARSIHVDRHLMPQFLDCDSDLMITSPDPGFGRSVRSVGEAIRWLARVAIVIYERVAL